MPSVSKSQQHLMGMIHAFKKGALKLSHLPKSLAHKIKKAAHSISGKAAREFAHTKTKGLPAHVKESVEKVVIPDMTFKDFLIFEHTLLQEITDDEFQALEEALERIEDKLMTQQTDEGIGDYFRGAGNMLGKGMEKMRQSGEQSRLVQQHQNTITRGARELAAHATDRLRAAPVAQRLVHAVLELNKMGINGYDALANEVMSLAKQASIPEMRERLKEAMRYFGVNSLSPEQQRAPTQQQPQNPQQALAAPPVQKQKSAPVQSPRNIGGVAKPFQSGGKARMVAGQYGPQYKFEDNRLDLSNVEFVNTMPTLIEFLAEDVLEEGKKKKKSLKKVARRVYHRDYEKTKNKPYRNYDPKRKEHAALTETSLQAFLDEYKAHDTKNALYHDMHLLRLISSQTQPTKVDVTEDSSTVRFFYPTTGKRSDIFEQYKNLFGEPTSRLQRDDVIEATFKDSATGTRVHISHDPKKDFFGSYRLNSNTAMGGLNEYIIQHITTVANMLSEGKISNRDVFLMLIETPGIGQPFGGGTNPDPYGQADLRRDVTGMTDQIVYLRGILAQHLKSDDHDWTFFSNAPTVEDAAHRLIGIVSKLPEAKSANRQAIQQTADQVARVYWGHGI